MPSPSPSHPAARSGRPKALALALLSALGSCREGQPAEPHPQAGQRAEARSGLTWSSPRGLRFEAQGWSSQGSISARGQPRLFLSEARLFQDPGDGAAPAQAFGAWFAALDGLELEARALQIELPAARLSLERAQQAPRGADGAARIEAAGRWLSLGPFAGAAAGAPFRFVGQRSGRRLAGRLESEALGPPAELELWLPEHELAGFELSLTAADGSYRLRFSRGLGRQRGQLDLEGARLPPALAAWLYPSDAARRALAGTLFSGWMRFEDAGDADRPAVEFELSAVGGSEERLDVRGRSAEGQLEFKRLELSAPGLELTLARWRGLRAPAGELPNADPGARLALELSAPGPRRPGALSEALLEGLLPGSWLEGLRWLGAQGRVQMEVDAGGRARLSAALQGPFGAWQLDGLDWRSGPQGATVEALRLGWEDLPLASLAPALARWPGLAARAPRSGSLRGRLELARVGERWSGRLEAAGRDLALGERPAGQLELELGLDSGRLRIASGRWNDGELALALTGGLEDWSPEQAEPWLSNLEAGPLALLAGLWQLDPGALALEDLTLALHLSGSAAAPTTELSGRARFEPRGLGAWSELLPLAPGQLELSGAGDGRTLELVARLSAGASQSLALAGRLDPPAGRLWLSRLEASAGPPLLELEGPLAIDLDSALPGDGVLRTPAGRLVLRRADRDGEQRLEVASERLDLEALPFPASTRAGRLARLVPEPLELQAEFVRRGSQAYLARLDLDWGAEQQLRLSAEPAGPAGSARASGSLRLGAVDPARLAAALGLEPSAPFGLLEGGRLELGFDLGERLSIRDLKLSSPSGSLAGSLGLELSLSELLADPRRLLAARGRLELSGQIDELGFLAQTSPALERVSGALRFETLSLERSELGTTGRGSVELSAGSVGFRTGFPSASDLSARLSWRDDELFLERLEGRLGAAPFQANGRIGLLGPGAPRFELFAEGKGLPIEQRRGLRLRSDATLHLSGAAGRARLEGRLRIVDGRSSRSAGLTAALTEGLSGARRPSSDWLGLLRPRWPLPAGLDLGLEIVAATPIDLEAGPLRLGLDPDLRLFGPADAPSLEGAIYLRPGRLDLPSGRLQISGGSLRFRPSGAAPDLELAARTRQKGHDLQVSVSGTLEDPNIEVSSMPPLAPRDALVLLSTGLLPDQALTARGGNQTARLLAVYLAQDLSRSLFGESDGERFLDRFEFAKGRDVAKDGTETLEANFLLRRGLWTPAGRLSLAGEYDVYKQVNFGVRWAIRWR